MSPTLCYWLFNKTHDSKRFIWNLRQIIFYLFKIYKKDDIVNSFKWIIENENKIKKDLDKFIPVL